jgi:hypothetical protein
MVECKNERDGMIAWDVTELRYRGKVDLYATRQLLQTLPQFSFNLACPDFPFRGQSHRNLSHDLLPTITPVVYNFIRCTTMTTHGRWVNVLGYVHSNISMYM